MVVNNIPKVYYFLFFLLLLVGAATAASHVQKNGAVSQLSVSSIEDIAKKEDTSFQAARQADATDVYNVVQNTLNGDTKPLDAQDYISDNKFFAKNNIDCTPEEMKINKRYIEFLDSASDVVDSYMSKSSDLQFKIDIMNEKKNVI